MKRSRLFPQSERKRYWVIYEKSGWEIVEVIALSPSVVSRRLRKHRRGALTEVWILVVEPMPETVYTWRSGFVWSLDWLFQEREPDYWRKGDNHWAMNPGHKHFPKRIARAYERWGGKDVPS